MALFDFYIIGIRLPSLDQSYHFWGVFRQSMAMSAVMLRLLRGYIMKNVNDKAEDSAGSNSIYVICIVLQRTCLRCLLAAGSC